MTMLKTEGSTIDEELLKESTRLYEGLRRTLLSLLDEKETTYGAIVNAYGALVMEAMLHDGQDVSKPEVIEARLQGFVDAMKKNIAATNMLMNSTLPPPESAVEDAAFVRKAEQKERAGEISTAAVPASQIEAHKDAFNQGLNDLLRRVGMHGDIPLHPREVVLKFFMTGAILALSIGASPEAVRTDFESMLGQARRLVLEAPSPQGAPS